MNFPLKINSKEKNRGKIKFRCGNSKKEKGKKSFVRNFGGKIEGLFRARNWIGGGGREDASEHREDCGGGGQKGGKREDVQDPLDRGYNIASDATRG